MGYHPRDFKSLASTNFATRAKGFRGICRICGSRVPTHSPHTFKSGLWLAVFIAGAIILFLWGSAKSLPYPLQSMLWAMTISPGSTMLARRNLSW